jgi:hypothetical protein
MTISSPFNWRLEVRLRRFVDAFAARLLAQIAITRFPAAAVSVIAHLKNLIYCTRVSRDTVVVCRDNDLV